MARYREKDETDLRWNRIRRRLTRELDIQIADVREELLNTILTSAWDKFSTALESKTKLDIEPDYKQWVVQALTEAGVGDDIVASLQAEEPAGAEAEA